jgi:hypothetical protein
MRDYHPGHNDSLTLVSNTRLKELLTMEIELRAAREVVEAARHMRFYCLGSDASTENMLVWFDQALKYLDEARRG